MNEIIVNSDNYNGF